MVRLILALTFTSLLFSCSSTPTSEPEILPCYKAKSFAEYDRLSVERFNHPGKPLVVKGKKYACIETDVKVESECYRAKTKKEFAKLSLKQEKGKGKPLRIQGKYFNCLQKIN